jgi:hypothetical protein
LGSRTRLRKIRTSKREKRRLTKYIGDLEILSKKGETCIEIIILIFSHDLQTKLEDCRLLIKHQERKKEYLAQSLLDHK